MLQHVMMSHGDDLLWKIGSNDDFVEAGLIDSFFFSAINEVTLLGAMTLASRGRVLPHGEALPNFLGKARFGPSLSYAVGPVRRRDVICPKIAVKVWEMSVS